MKVECIEKIRDKSNHIIGYKIINKDKNVKQVKPDELKKAIRSGKIEVVNLTLTSDNRLIDKKPDTHSKSTTTSSSKQNINAESLFNRIRSLGYNVEEFNTDCGHKCYLANSPDNTKHIFIIPDYVEYLYNKTNAGGLESLFSIEKNKNIYDYLSNIKGALKVVGGKNLISAKDMFRGCKVQSIDLSSLNTSKVTEMRSMFEGCKAQSIDLRSFNISDTTDVRWMFNGCTAQINANNDPRMEFQSRHRR